MSLLELTAAIANQLEQRLTPVIDVLQVTSQMNRNPTPPAVDLYPADPFQEPDAYGHPVQQQAVWTVRARVNTADVDYGQTLLLEMMDPASPKSVLAALAVDASFNNTCQDSTVESLSGYIQYTDPGSMELLGCQWRLRTILK